jgi:hypothetical protein
LGPVQIQAFFDKWQARLPWRLTSEDHQAGYRYRLSVNQVQFSRTQVFADPVRGRRWFEAVIRDNLDVGRPDRIQLLFERRTARTPGYFRTNVVQDPALRLGHPRVMAVLNALTSFAHIPHGFTNQSLRQDV